MKKKINKLNSSICVIVTVSFIAYYLLLHDNFLHTSISSIIALAHNLTLKPHLLVLGLLPIYIAAMIFGGGLLGVYLSSLLQQLLARFHKTK